jgi:hypothetical protein
MPEWRRKELEELRARGLLLDVEPEDTAEVKQ